MGLADRDYMQTPSEHEPSPPRRPWIIVVAVLLVLLFIITLIPHR